MTLSELPDINDANYYCQPCKVKHKDRGLYRRHLRDSHKIKLAPLKRKTVYDPIILVDGTQNPNNTSCAICKRKYNGQRYYQQHMEKYHKDGRNTPVNKRGAIIITNPNIQPDPNDRNLYCRSCQGHYSCRSNYLTHIRTSHPNVRLERKISKRNPIIMEIDAGNRNYRRCTICQKTYANRPSYTRHMNGIHKNGKREPKILQEQQGKCRS